MTPETYSMLQEWLKTGNKSQQQHARNRLSLRDAIEFKPIYPSLLQQAKNLAHAVGNMVESVVHGEPVTVSQEEQDRRLAICHACEKFDHVQGRCTLCGCYGKWKTWVASQKCPIGKWGES
jgi:Family of unknown function (DUF6171)